MLTVRYRTPDGRPLISATQVLTLAGRIDTTGFTPESAERGTRVHFGTERFDLGESIFLSDVEDDPKLTGYLDAYADFVATVRPVYGVPAFLATALASGYGVDHGDSVIERRVQSNRLALAGRIDRLCLNLFGGPAILDIKTGAPKPWHGEQLALYNRLCPAGGRYALYLRDTGRYKILRYDSPLDDRRAIADLNSAHRWLEMHKGDDDVWMLPTRQH